MLHASIPIYQNITINLPFIHILIFTNGLDY